MKKLYGAFVLIMGTLTLAACDNSKQVVETDLMHHRFALIKVNEQVVSLEKQAYIEFGEHFTVNGKMCNQFLGQATLDKGVIKSTTLASTEMLCSDEQLNQLDSTIGELFTNGATTKLSRESDKTYLQLKSDNNELLFELKDLM